MSAVGQTERATRNRVIALFRDRLHYDYLGDKILNLKQGMRQELLAAWIRLV